MKTKITRFDSVMNAIDKEVKKYSMKKHITIGIHEDAGMVEGGAMTQAKLGAIQHFGAGNIPARPFLDVGVSKGEKKYAQIVINAAKKNFSVTKTLNQLGLAAVGEVKQYMTDLQTPPNAQSTIKRKKGKDNPLINTGELRASITYKLHSQRVPKESGL